jgi:hypothetical protein
MKVELLMMTYKMSITRSLLQQYLPRDIVVIVDGYISPLVWSARNWGRIGHGEICMTMNDKFNLFIGVCRGGHYELVKLIFDQISSVITLNEGFKSACRGGHMDVVQFLLKYRVDVSRGLLGACRGGHQELVDLMIARGANNWSDGFDQACRSGHRELVKLMIFYGVKKWNSGLANACRGGHREIVAMMIARGANDWNVGLYNACIKSYVEIAKLMVRLGATTCEACGCIESHYD